MRRLTQTRAFCPRTRCSNLAGAKGQRSDGQAPHRTVCIEPLQLQLEADVAGLEPEHVAEAVRVAAGPVGGKLDEAAPAVPACAHGPIEEAPPEPFAPHRRRRHTNGLYLSALGAALMTKMCQANWMRVLDATWGDYAPQ